MMQAWMMILLSGFLGYFICKSRRKSFIRPNGVAIFISGCDSGIGKKLAEYFSGMGCLVFAGCLDPSRSSLPDNVKVIPLDIRHEESVREAVASVKKALDKEGKELWALVNNAGVCVYGPFEWQTARQRDWQVDVNVKGTMRLTCECIPLLKKSKGRIITVTSINGVLAYPGLSVYCATKFALEGFNKALKMELEPQHGIRVITVQPGDYARVTSIMSHHNDHAKEMWNNMPSDEQEQVGNEFRTYHTATLQMYGLTSPTSWEGSPLLRDMKEAVLSRNPPSSYLSAPFIHKLVYKFLTSSPARCRDFVLICMAKYTINNVDKKGEKFTL